MMPAYAILAIHQKSTTGFDPTVGKMYMEWFHYIYLLEAEFKGH